MKATELRIGNFIFASGKIIQVKSGYQFCRLEHSKYQPIPLTEEWLKMFGLSDHEQPSWVWVFGLLWLIKCTKDHIDEECPHYWALSIKSNVDDEFSQPIKYVHQVQNLYCALTGNELEITIDGTKASAATIIALMNE